MEDLSIISLSSLQNNLTEAAKNYNNGYISSQSYFPLTSDISESTILYNISEWKTKEHWFDWYESDLRKGIYSQYEILDNEKHVLLKARIPFNDIPLL